MKIYLTLLISLCLDFGAQARLMEFWNYDKLNDHATLVVIATPTTVKITSERAALPNIQVVRKDSKPENLIGTGVETSFKVVTVLKGDGSVKTLILHHFALADQKEDLMSGPGLVSFEPDSKNLYLMFLQKEADGRYVAVSGQTDPDISMKELNDKLSPVEFTPTGAKGF